MEIFPPPQTSFLMGNDRRDAAPADVLHSLLRELRVFIGRAWNLRGRDASPLKQQSCWFSWLHKNRGRWQFFLLALIVVFGNAEYLTSNTGCLKNTPQSQRRSALHLTWDFVISVDKEAAIPGAHDWLSEDLHSHLVDDFPIFRSSSCAPTPRRG